jgi:hypothetical protein
MYHLNHRWSFMAALCWLLVLPAMVSFAQAIQGQEPVGNKQRPNVLFILTDDQQVIPI